MGKKFELEFCRGGKAQRKTFTITEGPAHYDSAKRHKSEPLGLTVRNLTYEVRRYFHKTPEDPGVIVSKIEPGSKASVSGIKPYEIVTHVSEKPVANVGEFEKAIAGQEELRLAGKRMTKGRVVKIKMEAATTRPASEKD
jgi:S1-C subfamily serine protease